MTGQKTTLGVTCDRPKEYCSGLDYWSGLEYLSVIAQILVKNQLVTILKH